MNFIANNMVHDNPHHAHQLKTVALQPVALLDDHIRASMSSAAASSVVNAEPVSMSFEDPERPIFKQSNVGALPGDPEVKVEPIRLDQEAVGAKQHVRSHSIGPTEMPHGHPTAVNAHAGGHGVNPNPPVFMGLPHHLSFDFNLYPITNPPIFDSTFMLPYNGTDGVPRRRRISISNGQIGQIINHEAIYANEDTDQESVPPSTGYDGLIDTFTQHQHTPQQNSVVMNSFQGSVVQHDVGHVAVNSDTSRQNSVDPITGAAGVPPPNHQLIYNNEVIYNPNNGPIPGTAAWKKERLLERNRIAASKCRQRKKQAQQQLQNNITKYEEELNMHKSRIGKYELQISLQKRKIAKYERVFKSYNALLANHLAVCDVSGNDLNAYKLKVFLKYANIDDITDNDLHNLTI